MKLDWENLPPKNPQAFSRSLICIENIGTKEAHVLEIRIEFSYDDQPIIISKTGSIIGPGLTKKAPFDFMIPPVGKHEILGTVVVKHGRFRKKKRSYIIGYEFVKK